jgi:hypothetical protein
MNEEKYFSYLLIWISSTLKMSSFLFKREEMNLTCLVYVFMIFPSEINLTLNLINIKENVLQKS